MLYWFISMPGFEKLRMNNKVQRSFYKRLKKALMYTDPPQSHVALSIVLSLR
jgi:hypothetical protein